MTEGLSERMKDKVHIRALLRKILNTENSERLKSFTNISTRIWWPLREKIKIKVQGKKEKLEYCIKNGVKRLFRVITYKMNLKKNRRAKFRISTFLFCFSTRKLP